MMHRPELSLSIADDTIARQLNAGRTKLDPVPEAEAAQHVRTPILDLL